MQLGISDRRGTPTPRLAARSQLRDLLQAPKLALALPLSTTRGTIGTRALPPRARSAQVGNRLAARLPFAAVAGGRPVAPGFAACTLAFGPRTPNPLAALPGTPPPPAPFPRPLTGPRTPARAVPPAPPLPPSTATAPQPPAPPRSAASRPLVFPKKLS